MVDLETAVGDSLRERATHGLAAGGLHERVTARARAMRIRRRATGATGAGLAVVLAATAAMALPDFAIGGILAAVGEAPTTAPAPAATGGPTNLPAAPAPPAARKPDLVGTDPGVLHFDVNLAALKTPDATWTSGPGFEAVETPHGVNGESVTLIHLSPDRERLKQVKGYLVGGHRIGADGLPAVSPESIIVDTYEPVTVAGHPGTLSRISMSLDRGSTTTHRARPDGIGAWVLEWQPVPGLYAMAQVAGGDRALVLAAADALLLDRSQRCAVPLRFATPPLEATMTTCSTRIRATAVAGSVWIHSQVVLTRADGRVFTVYTEEQPKRVEHDTQQFKPTLTVAGHPATWLNADPRGLWIMNFGPMEVFVSGAGDNDQRLTQAEAVPIAAGLVIAEDLANPDSWPARPVG